MEVNTHTISSQIPYSDDATLLYSIYMQKKWFVPPLLPLILTARRSVVGQWPNHVDLVYYEISFQSYIGTRTKKFTPDNLRRKSFLSPPTSSSSTCFLRMIATRHQILLTEKGFPTKT